MLQETIFPLVTAYGFRKGPGISFILPGREVTIEGADEVLEPLLRECNGYKTLSEVLTLVSEVSDVERDEIEKLVEILFNYQILVDSHNYFQLFHLVSANPMPFIRNVSDEESLEMLKARSPLVVRPSQVSHTMLEELLEIRESTREFSGEPFTKEELQRLGWATYGRISRSSSFPESTIGLGTVPSGGALYPLRLFAIVLKESPSLCRGIYRLGPEGVRFIADLNEEELLPILQVENITFSKAGSLLVITCDFRQITQKYSNRGYRYALLEAGHAAQNSYLWCAEQGWGVVEIGGFNDEELAKILQLSYPEQAPLTVLVIGRREK